MKIFLDTAPLIYLIEGTEDYTDRVEMQLRQWLMADAILSTSSLTLMELLVIPKKQKNNRLTKKYRALLQELLSEPLLDLTPDIAETAAEIRSEYRFKTPDSIQLASALHNGADIFYTNDLRLAAFKDMTILTVDG
ncbi:MAG: type II toxin-antitoxin system VapC family toxin [Spirochaetales bacterium]|nr:type II toxin-antitoxin system VapC family toxin [Spirochaetales bacterium]